MEVKDTFPDCRTCPFILPYIEDIQRLESAQISLEAKARLIDEFGYLPEDVDRTDADSQLDLMESKQALSEAAVRTIGCIGVRIINLGLEDQTSAGLELVCQSVLGVDEPEDL